MATTVQRTFRVALTGDFYNAAGEMPFKDMGLSVLDADPQVAYFPLGENRSEIGAEQIKDANAVIVLAPRVTRETLAQAENLLAIGRFGVGYENVDVDACTEADVLAFITAGAVDRSVAEATVGWMLALNHHTLAKDRAVRAGDWDARTRYMGSELRDRTFGSVGLGGIARETIRLLSIFGMKQPLAFDPFVDEATAARLGVKLVSLDELLANADFVSLHCPLTEQTRGLIGARELGLMKPTAYLLNTARGGIVDEDALYEAVESGQIAGAAIDSFVDEPIRSPHRFGKLENMLLAPHSIAWTDELFRDIGQAVCQGMVDLAYGRKPQKGVLNPEVLERAGFQEKWRRLQLGG
ncbi:MAG: hydroxyacid dehydrogenase [Caldilineaceae bacterium]|nr:hydroxyacid dehydrogenase [Caldilineaceae bacterium]